MTQEAKNSRVAHVPAILAGSAALIAALSTLYVNLRNDRQPVPEPVAVTQPIAEPASTPVIEAPQAAAPTAPRVMLIRLDRLQVDNDGSAGSTNWTFQVSADEKPLFSVPMPSLSDKPGRNLVRAADAAAVSAEVELSSSKNIEVSAKGWKDGWLPGARAEVSGKAWLARGINGTVITVQGDKPDGPKFVLYFSVTDAAD